MAKKKEKRRKEVEKELVNRFHFFLLFKFVREATTDGFGLFSNRKVWKVSSKPEVEKDDRKRSEVTNRVVKLL
jgi:hypothetical protein